MSLVKFYWIGGKENLQLLEAIYMVSKANNHLQNLFEEFECRKTSNFSTEKSNILITKIGYTCLMKPLTTSVAAFRMPFIKNVLNQPKEH